ncbi:MAG: hypothetical protein EKK57_04025 [Proteobacteria bacterium]|nr:MAG: hypothetical protein EKK57_04025 [Pseudomonadota bacterium]
MIKDGVGGANTNKTGLAFERKVSIANIFLKIDGYSVEPAPLIQNKKVGLLLKFDGNIVARIFEKHNFYNFIELECGINWRDYLSKRLLPDTALLIVIRDTLFIIEVKYQEVSGSVDEKLQTCDFKRKQYQKLVKPLNYKVEFIYVLNKEWFGKDEYKDVLDYINSMNCHYVFDEIPLKWLGLPSERFIEE